MSSIKPPSPADKPEKSTQASKRKIILTRDSTTHLSPRFRYDPLGFLMNLGSEGSQLISGTDVKGFADYIGARIIYPEYTMEIKKALLGSERVKKAVSKLAQASKEEDIEKTKHVLWKQSIEIVNQMIAEMDSMRKLRVFAFGVTNGLQRYQYASALII
jgi:hypothetical protein